MPDKTQPEPTRVTASSFAERARTTLAQTAPVLAEHAFQAPSDFDLNPSAVGELGGEIKMQPAAVLVAIVARPEPHVIFTLRAEHLPVHSGQVSFPGGKVAPGDATVTETALREAHEEIGLAPEMIDVVGFLDGYHTGTGFLVAPVVAVISPEFVATPNPAEVAEVFEGPLAFFMTPENHRIDSKEYRQKTRKFYAMPYQDRYIWGATAGILRNLYTRLYASCSG